MKTWTCMLTMVLLLLAGAMGMAQGIAQDDIVTPRVGVAVAAPENPESGSSVPLYEKMDESSAVLMRYYSGTRMEVLRIEAGGMVWVQCGEQGASIMGYMRADDLRYGAQAMREVPRCLMRYTVPPATAVYAYCDERSGVMAQTAESVQIEVCGENDTGWGQLLPAVICQTGGWMRYTPDRGFVRADGNEAGELVVQKDERFVLPVEGEMTYEEAKARAIELLLASNEMVMRLDAQNRSREALEAFWSDVRLCYDPQTDTASWQVFLQAGEDHSQNFTIYMDAQGEAEEMNQGNG